ncbi:MAG: mechanosensitive ion channel [Myxococcota bacterium]
MDLTTLFTTVQERAGEILPNILAALAILILGWFAALVVRAVVRRVLGLLRLNERLGTAEGAEGTDVESGAAAGAYYLVLLFVLLAVFDALNLEIVSGPLASLVDSFLGYLPNLVAGGVLALLAVVVATVARTLVRRGLAATSIDESLAVHAGVRPVGESLATVVYWLVVLLFLPGILAAFAVEGLLAPVESMADRFLAMVPNLVAAAAIGGVGWLVARIVRDLSTNLLAATGADRVGEAVGLREGRSPSRLVGLVLYVLILIPAITAALEALKIQAITAPATAMLAAIMTAIPQVFAAALILLIAYLVARFAAGLVSELLAGAGFDAMPAHVGLAEAFRGDLTPSRLVGHVILFFVMLFAAVEAAGRLGFDQLARLVATFVEFGGQVLLGTGIIAVGFWLSGLARTAIERVYGERSSGVAGLTRFAILGLVLAMGLRAMGLADDIVNLAFGLTLGTIAVAVALSFGLGGREAAGRQMEHWLARLRGEG